MSDPRTSERPASERPASEQTASERPASEHTASGRGTSAPRPFAVLAATGGVSVLLTLATLVLAWVNGSDLAHFLAGNQANTWLAGLAFSALGLLIRRAQPVNRLGPLFTVAGLFAALCAGCDEYAELALRTHPGLPGADWAALGAGVLWGPAFLFMVAGVPLLYPAGRLRSPHWRWPARIALASSAVALLAMVTTEYVVDDVFPEASNPLDLPFPDDTQVAAAEAAMLLTLLIGLAAVADIALRLRRAPAAERGQHAWFVAALAITLPVAFSDLPDLVGFLCHVLAFAAIGVGIVRHHLFDIEVALSRALVYALLTGGALAAYLGAAALLGVATSVGPALVAAVAALALAAGRGRVQRAVDRLLYGERDPLDVLTTLGDRLEQAIDADAVLPAVVETVRQTLRLPYAAVVLESGEPACASGEPGGEVARFPLAHAGERIGELVVAPRAGERTLGAADRRILAAFARQAGVAAHGVRVTRELRRSRERIVTAREEERRRLRRDLHDGLGPALAGITLGLETAGRVASREGCSATALLASLRAESAESVEHIRRVVAGLRPAALDEIGLVAALARHADLLSAGPFTVRVTAPAHLPVLPAAVEVAAYRIASEAMTNAARHAKALTCEVIVELGEGTLLLTVADDGEGRLAGSPGVGLGSMRERAEELGGSCVIIFREGAGVTVRTTLPLAMAVTP
ncbi:sensor histidine kinase [Acrocarpospora catenulata]|uniref:sensor histidine kinase n=1 Tax=Acrocarpospora catenulata TaxID=2836182 RepID=UPI001BD93F5B|nr:histidine kinase [Acrocarpospora catenulata]